jgi:hypothetical protein
MTCSSGPDEPDSGQRAHAVAQPPKASPGREGRSSPDFVDALEEAPCGAPETDIEDLARQGAAHSRATVLQSAQVLRMIERGQRLEASLANEAEVSNAGTRDR